MVDKELIGVLIWLLIPTIYLTPTVWLILITKKDQEWMQLGFQYYGDDMSSFEGAVQIGNSLDSSVIAGLWKFNKWKYDFQFLAANYFKDIAIGTAWAGNIKKAGFKTEVSYFQPKSKFFESNGALKFVYHLRLFRLKKALISTPQFFTIASGISQAIKFFEFISNFYRRYFCQGR